MKLLIAETAAKCLSLARIARLVTDDLWRYCTTPQYAADSRRRGITDDRPNLKWGSWRKVLDGVRACEAVWIATDPDGAGEFLARETRRQILEQWPDRPVYRMRCPDVTAPSFAAEYRAQRGVDDLAADAHEAELAVNRCIADGLRDVMGGGGRALAPAVAELQRLHGVERLRVKASGITLLSRGPWAGPAPSPRELRPTLRHETVELPRPRAPTIQDVVADAPVRCIVAWQALQQLYAAGLVSWSGVDGEAVHEALRALGAEPGDPPRGGDVRPVDLNVAPSDVPPHLYETYLTLWCRTLASGATAALVDRTIMTTPDVTGVSTVLRRPGWMALRVDQPKPQHHEIPEVLCVQDVSVEPWSLTEQELFERFEARGLRYRNVAVLLKVLEDQGLLRYQGRGIVPTQECRRHHELLRRVAPELLSPTFFEQCRARMARIASGDVQRREVVAQYRRWVDAVKNQHGWKSKSARS